MATRLSPASAPLRGTCTVPGDKSIGHRALILAALGDGDSVVRGLSGGADVASTRRCLEALGVGFDDLGDGAVRVHGAGLHGLTAPEGALDAGNSGTTVRLLSGVACGRGFEVTFEGDASLSRRPMDRIATPLRQMGAVVEGRTENGRLVLPLTVAGDGAALHGIGYASPVASAQVKSCVLLAGLRADGRTSVEEPARSRDHTERMLAARGVAVEQSGLTVSITGPAAGLSALDTDVPGDPSSAAFLVAAAIGVPGSDIHIEDVCLNETRTGFLRVLGRMGASVTAEGVHDAGGEAVGAIVARYTERLAPVRVDPAEVPALVDEVPILAALATRADGESRFEGVGELRVKESDRIESTVAMLRAFGAEAEGQGDALVVHGRPYAPLEGGACITTHGDHRIAMTAAVLALAARGETELDDPACIAVSFPGFLDLLTRLQRA